MIVVRFVVEYMTYAERCGYDTLTIVVAFDTLSSNLVVITSMVELVHRILKFS